MKIRIDCESTETKTFTIPIRIEIRNGNVASRLNRGSIIGLACSKSTREFVEFNHSLPDIRWGFFVRVIIFTLYKKN